MKVVNQFFPMARSAYRIALLSGILSKTVTDKEIESVMLKDSETRKRKKPVRAEGIYFESVTDAAKFFVNLENGRMKKEDFFDAVQARSKKIARMCNQDCWEGYYWEN